MPPRLSEIEDWVLKTEARLGATVEPDAQRIFAAYHRVLRCFARDLDDPPRRGAFARGGADAGAGAPAAKGGAQRL